MEKTLRDLNQYLKDTVQSIFQVQRVAVTIEQEMCLLRKKAQLVDELLSRNLQLEKMLFDSNVHTVQEQAVDVGRGHSDSDWPSAEISDTSPQACSSTVSCSENLQNAELYDVVIKQEPIDEDQSIIDNQSITIDTRSIGNQPTNSTSTVIRTTDGLQQFFQHQTSSVIDVHNVAATSRAYQNSTFLGSQSMSDEYDGETDQSQETCANQPPIRCAKCSFVTFIPYSLNVHMRQRHLNKKLHKCPTCPYETVRSHNLKRHISYNRCGKRGRR